MASLSDREARLRLEAVMDYGVRGIRPEPRRGYRSSAVRLVKTQEFCDAALQRHEASGWAAPQGPARMGPRDWKQLYALELVENPLIFGDLQRSALRHHDGLELVFERASLSAGERAILRMYFAGDEPRSIAYALRWRPQTVTIILENGLDRLRELGMQRGHVGSEGLRARRAGRAPLLLAAPG